MTDIHGNATAQDPALKSKKVLITGGTGLLGNTLVRDAIKTYKVIATYNSHPHSRAGANFIQLDVKDQDKVKQAIDEVQPDIIIHSAALRSIDYCEKHQDEAWAINVTGAENMARAAKSCSAKLLFISSDSVFDGKKGNYTEEDTPNPVTFYGKTKLEAEKRIRDFLPGHIIIRANSIYGWSLHGQSLAEWILNDLRNKKQLKMFADTYFTPILSNNFAQIILEMCHKNISGLYHISGNDKCSRSEFATQIALIFNQDKSLVLPVNQSEGELGAERGKDSSLSISKAQRDLQTSLLNLKDSLAWFRDLEGTVNG